MSLLAVSETSSLDARPELWRTDRTTVRCCVGVVSLPHTCRTVASLGVPSLDRASNGVRLDVSEGCVTSVGGPTGKDDFVSAVLADVLVVVGVGFHAFTQPQTPSVVNHKLGELS